MSSSKYIHSHDYLYEIVGCYGCVSLLHLVYKQFCLVLYCDHSPICLRFLDCQEHHWKTSCGSPLVECHWWEWKQQLEIWIYICIHLSQEQHQIPRILNLLVSLIPESSGHSWFSLLLFGIRIISSLSIYLGYYSCSCPSWNSIWTGWLSRLLLVSSPAPTLFCIWELPEVFVILHSSFF